MDALVFPPSKLMLKNVKDQTMVYDIIRKKYIVLTPEEWVRQHLLHYLINHKKYPKGLISIEDGLIYSGMRKRSDVVVYNRTGGIYMLAECKSPRVNINQKSMEQLSLYNQHYRATYLVLTNGLAWTVHRMNYETKCFEMESDLPEYK